MSLVQIHVYAPNQPKTHGAVCGAEVADGFCNGDYFSEVMQSALGGVEEMYQLPTLNASMMEEAELTHQQW